MPLLKEKALVSPGGNQGPSGTRGAASGPQSRHAPCPHSLPTRGCSFPLSSQGRVGGAALPAVETHPTACMSRNTARRWSTCLSTSPNFNHVLTPSLIPLTVFLAPKRMVGAYCLNQSCFNIKGYLIHILIIGVIIHCFFFFLFFLKDKRCYINPAWKTFHIWKNTKTNPNTRNITI